MSFDYSGTKYVISQKTCFLKCWNANVRDYSLVRPTCGAQNNDSSQKSTSTTVIGDFYTVGLNFRIYHKNRPHLRTTREGQSQAHAEHFDTWERRSECTRGLV